MPEAAPAKVGVVSCSGEELAVGTVTRLATLKLLHELRPRHAVTICLPLFLAGGEGDREFARRHPTIAVDGCDLRCAARGTERYSGTPVAGVVVEELLRAEGLPPPEERRCLGQAGRRAVDAVARRLAALVDEVLAGRRRPGPGRGPACPDSVAGPGANAGADAGADPDTESGPARGPAR